MVSPVKKFYLASLLISFSVFNNKLPYSERMNIMKGSMRKRYLKKALALVSTLAMMGSLSNVSGASEILSYNVISASAEGEGNNGNGNNDGTPDGEEETKKPELTEEEIAKQKREEEIKRLREATLAKADIMATAGYTTINLQITNYLEFKDDFNCTVKIYKVDDPEQKPIELQRKVIESTEDGKETEKYETVKNDTVPISKKSNTSVYLRTPSNLQNGKYRIEVNAPGLKKYSQETEELKDSTCNAIVNLGFNENIYTYETTTKEVNGKTVAVPENHPGTLAVGDVNDDGSLDERDLNIMLSDLDASARNGKEKSENDSDLNHDGKIDLTDFTFFAKNYLKTRNWSTDATVMETVVAENLSETAMNSIEELLPDDVEITGDISALFSSDNSSVENENSGDGEEAPPPNMIQIGRYKPVLDENGNEVLENGKPKKEPVAPSIEEPLDIPIPLGNTPLEKFTIPANIDSGSVEIVLADNTIISQTIAPEGTYPMGEDEKNGNFANVSMSANVDESGNLSVNLGKQVAVKMITLTLTAVKSTNLAQIGKVQMLNGMEKHMAPPAIDYPTNVKIAQDMGVADKDAKITVTWDIPLNVEKRFEIEVSTSPNTKSDGSFASTIPGVQNSIVYDTNTYSLQSEHGNFKLIKINTTYYVHVRVVGEDYRSAWSEVQKVTTVSNSLPDKPDNVQAKADYRQIKLTWNGDNTNSTTGYKIFYKDLTNEETEYKSIVSPFGTQTSYTLTDLEDLHEYEIYVKSTNPKGESSESVHTKAKTITLDPVIMRQYNAINVDENNNPGSAHIVSVTRAGGQIIGENEKDAENAEAIANGAKIDKTAWSVVDGDQRTYYTYKSSSDPGLIFEFDKEYDIGSFGLTIPVSADLWIINAAVWNEETNSWKTVVSNYKCTGRVTDKNNKTYYIKTFNHFKGKKIKIWFGNYTGHNEVTYSEILFYEYSTLYDEIMALYEDDLHTVLKDGLTQADIDELRTKINTPDPRNDEDHPEKAMLNNELNTAEKILKSEKLAPPVVVHNGITTHDPIEAGTSRRYNGLNAWQPLGVTAGSNTKITVYVGGKNSDGNIMKTGEGTNIKLIATQYNSESGGLTLLNEQSLNIGANTFTIPTPQLASAEGGGALYVQYQNTTESNERYSVRVEGGTNVPFLDIYQMNDHDEKVAKAVEYIEALNAYVAKMPELHNEIHKGAKDANSQKNSYLDMDYNAELCILGATDILDDTMMYSLPATQILAGLGNGSTTDRAEKLINSMDAMEKMVKFFYQHKGMSDDATAVVDRIPNKHLNIRYQRMFQGAFMYAAGNHIGIQYGSVPDMVRCEGVRADENGKYQSGSYFGWGIAHEIGHCLNDLSYAVPEITNNYFSMLAQAQDKNEGSRLNYTNIYKKVTSNTSGQADQGTQLGMYWQLHLAFDKDYNFKTYGTHKEIIDNLFYAKMDQYSRDPSKANNVKKETDLKLNLELNDGTDQNLMRLACAASGKNVLEFFRRWGKTPNFTTELYASQFPDETRAIQYANENSRIIAKNGSAKSFLKEDKTTDTIINSVGIETGKGSKSNIVTLTINTNSNYSDSDILGYEIRRCTISGGDIKETPVTFLQGKKTYVDTVTAFNNRTVFYKVVAVDQYLNYSNTVETIRTKIEHDGSLAKTNWTITSDYYEETSDNSTEPSEYFNSKITKNEPNNETMDCHPVKVDPVINAFDDNVGTYFEATVKGEPNIYVNFNEPQTICGIKLSTPEQFKDSAIKKCAVFVKDEEGNWKNILEEKVKGEDAESEKAEEKTFVTFNEDGIIYFSKPSSNYIATFETSEIKIQILDKNDEKIYISEFDVLGVTGDNVYFTKSTDSEKEDATLFGQLANDYLLDKENNIFIPKDSYVFIGNYKGNPSYNAVILFNEKGRVVGQPPEQDFTGLTEEEVRAALEEANKTKVQVHQVLMAPPVPEGSLITEISKGTFIYWITHEEAEKMEWPEKVRVELYRVNNALTSEGQRIVSDSLLEPVPKKNEMPRITLSDDNQNPGEIVGGSDNGTTDTEKGAEENPDKETSNPKEPSDGSDE